MQKHILNDGGFLNKEMIVQINVAFLEAKNLIKSTFKSLPMVDIVFAKAPDLIIPKLGFGARVFSSNLILISLDPSKKIDKNELKYSICHEVNHIIRTQFLGEKSFFNGSRLIDGIIAEGIAETFEVEVGRQKPMTTFNNKIKEKELKDGLREALDIDDKDYSHKEWFFSENGKRPYWFGYNLGIYVVDKYCQKHKKKSSEITCLKTDEFVRFAWEEVLD